MGRIQTGSFNTNRVKMLNALIRAARDMGFLVKFQAGSKCLSRVWPSLPAKASVPAVGSAVRKSLLCIRYVLPLI